MVELNRLFQIDRGKIATAARIEPPKQTRRPLPYLLIQSFFYVQYCTGQFLQMLMKKNLCFENNVLLFRTMKLFKKKYEEDKLKVLFAR